MTEKHYLIKNAAGEYFAGFFRKPSPIGPSTFEAKFIAPKPGVPTACLIQTELDLPPCEEDLKKHGIEYTLVEV